MRCFIFSFLATDDGILRRHQLLRKKERKKEEENVKKWREALQIGVMGCSTKKVAN